MSLNISQFKQQTFEVIRQQATKLKTNIKQLEIKQEQIRLLKNTIQTLEDEKHQSQKINRTLRGKIDIIMKEIENYNVNVVHKIQADNEMLSKRNGELQSGLEESLENVKSLTRELQNCEENSQKFTFQNGRYKQINEKYSKELQRLTNENTKMREQILVQERNIHKLEALNEQMDNKIKMHDMQIDSLMGKCQDTVRSYEKKLKNLKETLVKPEDVLKLEDEIGRLKKRNEEMKKQNDKINKQKKESSLALKVLKEKQTSSQIQNGVECSILQADFRTMKNSCKIGKKISEFESKYAEMFYETFSLFLAIFSSNQINQKNVEILQQKVNQLESQLSHRQSELDECKTEVEILAEKLKSESQTIESSYEGKILQLSIKIKKQEKALHQLSIKDRQFEALTTEYDKLAQQHVMMKQTLENTIRQQKKQNQKLTTQVQELIHLCDQNIHTKNSLNILKHTLNNVLAVIYFLHLSIVRGRQARRKLYEPFIDFYFKSMSSLKSIKNNSQKSSPLFKLRSCVVMVMAINRMTKNSKQIKSSGLLRYAEKAIKTKGKIEDLSEYLQVLLQRAIDNEKNTSEFLSQNKIMYKWNNVHNYMKVNLPINKLESFVRSAYS